MLLRRLTATTATAAAAAAVVATAAATRPARLLRPMIAMAPRMAAAAYAPAAGRPHARGFHSSARTRGAASVTQVLEQNKAHTAFNVPADVAGKIGRNLHRVQDHPLNTIKRRIEGIFKSDIAGPWQLFDDLEPVVTKKQNFDSLLIPQDHVSRSPTDTFYLNDDQLLRCHTSAHQVDLISAGHTHFLVVGDVYRRDSVDCTHYPIFHQMEGVKIFEDHEIAPGSTREQATPIVVADLKKTLEHMVRGMFGNVEIRWVDAYFPFTDPSFEMEIFFNDEWLEVLGCGMIAQPLMDGCKQGHRYGYAFGLGLERLAMVLFGIPDIRLFWSQDPRFLDQFKGGSTRKFQPYSKYPACYKDIAFWLSPTFHMNDLHEIVRSIGGDLVERVQLIDSFKHPKTGQESHCYRIMYRSMDRSLTNAEIDAMQEEVRRRVAESLKCTLR